jgi:hypothetical protein
MLNEGMIRNFDVIVLLGKTIQDTSEYGPAASVSEAIMKLVPGLSCDTRSLLIKAKTYEQDLRRVRSERKNSSVSVETRPTSSVGEDVFHLYLMDFVAENQSRTWCLYTDPSYCRILKLMN